MESVGEARLTVSLTAGRLPRVHGAVILVGVAVSVAVLLQPPLAAGIEAPPLRLVIEVAGLFLALTAALTLSLTERQDLGAPRDAFIAALLVLAVTNATFAVLPALLDVRPPVDRGLAFYPWVASRFIAGGFMLAAGLGRPRLGPRRTVLLAFAILAAVQLAMAAVGDRMPTPVLVEPAADGTAVVVAAPLVLAGLSLVPAVMFGAGAWLAAGLYRRGAAPLYAWLSVAMTVQVFSQVHAVLAPAFLGPRVTTMDVFRSVSWVLLAAGALAQLQHLYRSRSRTAARQSEDLREQSVLLSEHQRLAEQEQDFRAIVSHELATPVAAIRAFAHVLETPGASEQRRREAIAGVQGEAARLGELIDRIDQLRQLDLADVGCELRPLAIRPFLDEVRAFALGLPGAPQVSVRCEEDRVLGDPIRLGQILRNLVGNAVRYAGPGAPIHLTGEIVGRDGFAVHVVDEGPGIPPEERARLVRPYARGSRASEHPGSGLGLYICTRIAEAHGGRLELREGPRGHGTDAVVLLRRAR